MMKTKQSDLKKKNNAKEGLGGGVTREKKRNVVADYAKNDDIEEIR